ncbi:MAG: hypothetical protein JWO15_2686 [Sphingomonadales bacterium]|nr:hypothetical protein [Sphingomonadales bacterium]
MNIDAADAVGIAGSVLFIVAFMYANAVENMDKLLFNALNLIGAILLLYSLSIHFNLASTVLEVAWAIIAFVGLVQAIRARRSA